MKRILFDRCSPPILILLGLLLLPITSSAKAPQVTLDTLKQREQEIQKLVEKTLPCTVCVVSANGQGSGSGVIVSEDGIILTAAHVTAAAGKNLVIIFPDGRRVPAKTLGANRYRDASLVQITKEGKYPFAPMGKSSELKKDQWCVSLGHAGGFDPKRTPPVRLGRIIDSDGAFVITDCALIGGDSGGPLFDLQGNVIGIHSNIGATLSQNQHVPVDVYSKDWDKLKEGTNWGRSMGAASLADPDRPMLGVEMEDEPVDGGAAIYQVTPRSPADKAGLKKGDIIIKADGKDVTRPRDLQRILRGKKPGQKVKFEYKREDKVAKATAKLIRAIDLARGNMEAPKKPLENTDPKIAELLRKAREQGGIPKLTPEEQKLVREEMARRLRGIGVPAPSPNQRDVWFEQVAAAYQAVVRPASKSTVRVLVEKKAKNDKIQEEHVALATAINKDGWFVTKASEIKDQAFKLQIGGKKFAAELVKQYEEHDLAVIRSKEAKAAPVSWFVPEKHPPLGAFVASVGSKNPLAAIGVVSVKTRSLTRPKKGFLGVLMEPNAKGVRLVQIVPRSPARGKLKTGDIVVKINDKDCKTPDTMAKLVGAAAPGESVKLTVLRKDSELEVKVKLVNRADFEQASSGRQQRMERMGTEISENRSGYALALQHDCPISPQHCGGPLVDLSGRVLGVNIARASRVKSYAVPAQVVKKLVEDAMKLVGDATK